MRFYIHSSVTIYVAKLFLFFYFQESEYCVGIIQFILPLGNHMIFVYWIKFVRYAIVTFHFYVILIAGISESSTHD